MPLKDPIARAAYQKKWNREHPENTKMCQSKYYKGHREKGLAYSRKYRKDHREEINVYKRQYNKDHPEVDLKSKKKTYKKLGITRWNMQAWTKVIRKGKNCSYCDSDKDLNSHHLLSKFKFPGLALSENNGIPLCATCHKMHHALNGVTA